MSLHEHKLKGWKAFTSLNWYDGAIEFLFRFVAKTSEPLLAAGIVYSAADVLSKGHLGSTSATMDNLWAISQALAIESSGGVVLVYGLESMKAKDYVKAWLYLILSALLALTGGVMLFMQLAGLENQQAGSPLMLGLFALRCVVSVGYIYLCRTKAISFRKPDTQGAITTTQPANPAPAQESAQIDYPRLAQELAPLLQAVRTTIIEEVKASITVPARDDDTEQHLLFLDAGQATRSAFFHHELSAPERLEFAYQQLLQGNNGQRVSGRALAKQAHVDRQACVAWLRTTHPENEPQLDATDNQPRPQPDITTTTTASQPVQSVTATATTQPQTERDDTANQPGPQREAMATVNQAETDARTTIEPEPRPGDTASSAATTGQREVHAMTIETATASGSASESQPETTATTVQPRSKTRVTTTRKTPQPRPPDQSQRK